MATDSRPATIVDGAAPAAGTAPAVTIDRATEADWPAMRVLLEASGLPLAGLERAAASAVVATAGGAPIGCAAIEPYGRAGLLRSVAVDPEFRALGVGRGLVAAAERLAVDLGIEELLLLTETAAAWFPRLGYLPVDRSEAPAEMAASPEFAGACPVSAAAFRKRLTGRASA